MKQTGKLTSEQFALAMWFIQQKLAGVDPPAALTPEMIPPTMRPKPSAESAVSVVFFIFVLCGWVVGVAGRLPRVMKRRRRRVE